MGEIESKISFLAQNAKSEVTKFVEQHSENKQLQQMVEKENELFLAKINNKTSELNMNLMKNKYLNQEDQINKLHEENKKKNDILNKQHEEFERIQEQLNSLKSTQETQLNQKVNEQNELKKQLTFYKMQYEEEMKANKLEIERQKKENEE